MFFIWSVTRRPISHCSARSPSSTLSLSVSHSRRKICSSPTPTLTPDPLPPPGGHGLAGAGDHPRGSLVEIFLRLPTLAALARAAAACTSFRRLIKDRAFRRRFCSLHRPPLLGFMDAAGFHPAEAPHPSAPLAGALAPCAEDFSFVPPVVSSASYLSSASPSASYFPVRFLPGDEELPRWRPRDARDGRVLLDWVSLHLRFVRMWGNPEDGYDVSVLMDCNELADHDAGARASCTKRERCNGADFHLAVCDPLSRRYELLPNIPEDFAARPEERLFEFVPMLAPTTEDEPVKVICMAIYHTKLVLFVFISTPTTRQWRMATFPILTPQGGLSCFDCVRGCFYWTEPWQWSDYLLMLDTRTMRFSHVHLLTGYHVQLRDLPDQSTDRRRPSAVVVGREGTIEMFSLVGQGGSFTLHHTSLSLQNDKPEWKLEKIIPLPGQHKDYSISTVGAAEGFLFFRGAPKGISGCSRENVDCYSLEVKTYEITKVCSKKEHLSNPKHALPYFTFPPLLSEQPN
ncbi:hypothetical protein ACQ4PT_000252 [Festuca glaucescens]